MSIFGKPQLPPESGWQKGTYGGGDMFAGYEEASKKSLEDLKYAARDKGGHIEVYNGKIHLYVGSGHGTFDDCVGGVEDAMRALGSQ